MCKFADTISPHTDRLKNIAIVLLVVGGCLVWMNSRIGFVVVTLAMSCFGTQMVSEIFGSDEYGERRIEQGPVIIQIAIALLVLLWFGIMIANLIHFLR